MEPMAKLIGNQTPTYLWVPEGVSSAGQEAIAVAKSAGQTMDPWQATVLNGAAQERFDTDSGSFLWQSNEVVLIVARQNGKGGILEARELAGIFVWNEPYIMHSAHEFKTAASMFKRMTELLEGNPDMDRRVHAVSRSKGDEGFEFRWKHENYSDGKDPRCRMCKMRNRRVHKAWLKYFSRTGGAGRGFDGVTTVILDEAMILDDAPISAMLPTLATQPNWQVWYVGSAGSKTMRSGSVVLARVRRRGHAKDPGVMMAEYAAHLRHTKACIPDPEGNYDHGVDDRLDPATHLKCNPAAGTRISLAYLRAMANGGMDERDFDREFLGDGDWPEPDGWNLVSEELWGSLKDIDARGAGAPPKWAVGVETTWDQEWTAITIVGQRPDKRWHMEMIECRPGTHWAPDYLRLLVKRRPMAVVIDKTSPANVIAAEVESDKAVKRYLVHPTLQQYAAWASKATQLMLEPGAERIVHLSQPTLDKAVRYVRKREIGQGAFVWERIGNAGNTAPWIAGTMAIGGVVLKGKHGSGRPLVASANLAPSVQPGA